MTENLIYSLNAVTPIILVVMLGAFIKKIGLVNDEFLKIADKLVFKLALPVYIFNEVCGSKTGELFNINLVIFCVAGILAVFGVTIAVMPLLVKKRESRGAVLQAVFRSNFAILGLPLAGNLYGDIGSKTAALVIPFAIPLYNILAVIALTVTAPKTDSKKLYQVKKIILDILKNPLIIAVVLGLIFMNFKIPVIMDKTVKTVAGMSTPLALLSLGAGFKFENVRNKLSYSIFTTLARILFVPLAATAAAIFFGFRDADLVIIFVLFGAPTAVSSYIMAKNMGADYELAGQIIVFSTIMSAFTVFAGSLILRTLGYI